MSNNQIYGPPMSARSEILPGEKLRNQPIRSSSQRAFRPSAPVCCSVCKLPLLTDFNPRETFNKSRAATAIRAESLCQECTQEKVKNGRTTSSRLFKSPSVNWSNKGNNIETWFEKAKTPDQRVVYNFLQQINDKQNEKKDLDDVLNNLKKYQTRFDSSRSRSKFTRLFESSSWRVMRHPAKYHQPYYNTEHTSDIYTGSIFATTAPRKIGSTFLIHPNWI